MTRPLLLGAMLALAIAARPATGAAAQQKPQPQEPLEVLQVAPNFYMIAGAGANIALQIGADGIVVVDTGSGARSKEVLTEIRRLSPRPVRYIINTSAEPDHVGGNDDLSRAGQSVIPTGGLNEIGAAGGRAPILAEENVLTAMGAPTGEKSAYPVGAWPTVTYSSELGETQKDVYFNGEAVQIFYQPAAHAAGDSVVLFRRSDVVVTGELFDMTRFPLINVARGGTVQGVIDGLNRIIGLTVAPVPLTWQGDGTVVIPAHGAVAHEADVVDYRDMVTIVRDRVQALMSKGLTLEQILKSDPTKGYRRRYGADTGPWTTRMFVEAVYRSLGGK